MDLGTFREWLAGAETLTAEQRQEVCEVLVGRPPEVEVVATIEDRLRDQRRCPQCDTTGAVRCGRANGLQRYRCKACRRSFNALTGTPLARLRHKERWLAFADSLKDRMAVRRSAQHCGVAATTAFRWRHRFLQAIQAGAARLVGIVEADETFVLDSRKGDRRLDRPARRRGGKASKRGLSREQIAVLVAVDRAGTTRCAVLPAVTAKAIEAALGPALDTDALLVTDGNAAYPPCAAALGVSHQALNQSAGERVRGECHLQTVNNRHQRLKSFLAPFRGVATTYLSNYLRWFDLAVLRALASARTGLNAAIGLHAKVAVPS